MAVSVNITYSKNFFAIWKSVKYFFFYFEQKLGTITIDYID